MLEDVGLKQRIFADLEKACRPDCILSSNTSTIDISLIGAKTRAQVRHSTNTSCTPHNPLHRTSFLEQRWDRQYVLLTGYHY